MAIAWIGTAALSVILLLGQSNDLPMAGIDLATRTELASRALELRDDRIEYVAAAGYALAVQEHRYLTVVSERERDRRQDQEELGQEPPDGEAGQYLQETVVEPHIHPSEPAPVAYTGSIPSLIRSIFAEEGVGEWGDFAVSVANCESGFNPNAVGGSGEVGLFQLLPVDGLLPTFYAYGFSNWASPEEQSRFVARYIRANSWNPWSCA